MEKGKKSMILLVAFILGIGFLIAFGFVILDELIVTDRDYAGGKALYNLTLSKEEYQRFYPVFTIIDRGFWYVLLLFIISIPAILLNFFGWFKNRAKNILISAILYLVSLNIPSAVLCFIGFRKLKKQNVI